MINVTYFQMENHFCTNDEYSLKYFINGQYVSDIRSYEIVENDKIFNHFWWRNR